MLYSGTSRAAIFLCKIDLQCSVAHMHSDGHNGGRVISTGPVHGKDSREKKLKRNMSSVRGVRVSPGRFVWLYKPS